MNEFLIALYSDFAVVRVDIDQSIYEITEDAGRVEICASLSGPNIERSLMVFLVTSEDTAKGIIPSSISSRSMC